MTTTQVPQEIKNAIRIAAEEAYAPAYKQGFNDAMKLVGKFAYQMECFNPTQPPAADSRGEGEK